MRKISAALCLCPLLTVPALAANVVLYDSTADPLLGAGSLAGCGCAFSFSAPGFASNLIDVQVSLVNHTIRGALRATPLFGPSAAARTAGAAIVGSLTFSLYSNNPTGPQPASQLITLGSTLLDTSLTSSLALYDFPPGAPFGLTPNARYWVFVTSNSSIGAIGITGTSAGTGVVNEFSWPPTSANNSTNGSAIALVVATPTTPGIPVPPSVILTLVGLACVGFYIGSRRFAVN